MRSWARILLVALVLAPWSPVAGCPSAEAMAVAAASVDTASDDCCCGHEATAADEGSCCTMPEADAAGASESTPPSSAPSPEGAPCCHAGNAPAPYVPAPAVVTLPAPGPLAIVAPEPWFAAAAGDPATQRVATTESPPGSDPLAALSSNRLRL